MDHCKPVVDGSVWLPKYGCAVQTSCGCSCTSVVSSLVLAENGRCFSIVHVKLNHLLKPVFDCSGDGFAKHNLMGDRAFWNSPIKWILSDVDLVVSPACPINCLNSVTSCSAVFLPCFKFSSLQIASWTQSADWNALLPFACHVWP